MMAFVSLASLIVPFLFLAVSATAQVPMFYASPENSTYMVGDGEEKLSVLFTCVAINVYKVDWIINGSEMGDDDHRTHQSTARSILKHAIPVGDSVEVVCRAWRHGEDDPSLESEPATISVLSCNCSHQNPQHGTGACTNTMFTLISSIIYPAVEGSLGISLIANCLLIVIVIVLIIVLCRENSAGAQRQLTNPVEPDGDNGPEDVIEMDGRRPHSGGANVRRRPGQRR